MSDNSMRTNLIMHFHCADCGNILKTSYEGPKPKGCGEDEPTGAACRYVPAIHVEPCGACIEMHTGPAKRLASALNELSK